MSYPEHLPKYSATIDNYAWGSSIKLYRDSPDQVRERNSNRRFFVFGASAFVLFAILSTSIYFAMSTNRDNYYLEVIFLASTFLFLMIPKMFAMDAEENYETESIHDFPEEYVARVALKGHRDDYGFWRIPHDEVQDLERKIQEYQRELKSERMDNEVNALKNKSINA